MRLRRRPTASLSFRRQGRLGCSATPTQQPCGRSLQSPHHLTCEAWRNGMASRTRTVVAAFSFASSAIGVASVPALAPICGRHNLLPAEAVNAAGGNDGNEEPDPCAICLEPPTEAVRTQCNHRFCLGCFRSWAHRRATADVARAVPAVYDCCVATRAGVYSCKCKRRHASAAALAAVVTWRRCSRCDWRMDRAPSATCAVQPRRRP